MAIATAGRPCNKNAVCFVDRALDLCDVVVGELVFSVGHVLACLDELVEPVRRALSYGKYGHDRALDPQGRRR
ncbi:hypothetical protein [Streptomyces sp. WM6378]|uniref:hypothetical protein n=1 Tax=Streptomyces sp. WM6378 TaxID=1415557 RepID=UPI0006C2552D|nr:hypothetical protein [Streptomyces sp. WM6378]KOU52301.1 hypothetical protein ADK54_07880 [Streptomyces sp. WM6378]